ncbi:MAG: hypothetical protein M1829_005013 [Trizodia sp. TS-e1964]|nr:MAG: hypothetical protein M1829_005013 [Trizodia sp. TS-e1964]
MASTTKKPPPGDLNRRTSVISPTPAPRGPVASVSAITRSRSTRNTPGAPVSARAAAKRPGAGNTSLSSTEISTPTDTDDEDIRGERTAARDELRSRLDKAETMSEEYQRQIQMLQQRLNDALAENSSSEERSHEREEKIMVLENDRKDLLRQRREMENIYEAERAAMVHEKEQSESREQELKSMIHRLKEALAQRDEEGRPSKSSNASSPILDSGHFAPPSAVQRSDSRNNSKLLLQKDKMIESLRLELAEAQIKVVESENRGGGRMQELERVLMETRISNARLMEDNESFQLLLSEKTLNGDFSKTEFMQSNASALDALEGKLSSTHASSLADELESVSEGGNSETCRLEAELRSSKDQNKALTLYINNIIGRLLQHDGFEAILDKTPELMGGVEAPKPPSRSGLDKELPPPPKEASTTGPSLLQRAKSVAVGANRSRPTTMMPPPSRPTVSPPLTTPTSTVDGSATASTPLGRSQSVRTVHRRSASEMVHSGQVVNQMYRGPAMTSPIAPQRQSSFFAPRGSDGTPARHPLGGSNLRSSSGSSVSEGMGDVDTPSPPRSSVSSVAASVIAGNKVRPLRLVQENSDGGGGGKRGSWMGWFNRGKEEGLGGGM